MRTGAVIGVVIALVLLICFTAFGVDERITIQQAIMCGALMAGFLICISNMEK